MAGELDLTDRFTKVLHEAACQGYDSGCKAALGGPWRNPFEKSETPNLVFLICFKIGKDVTTRRALGGHEGLPLPTAHIPAQSFAMVDHQHDDVEFRLNLAGEIQRLADRCSDLESAVALFGAPARPRKSTRTQA